jgi:Tol biopolymer transport system component
LAHPTHWTFSFAENKNLYFTSEMPGVRGEQDIYMASFDGEKYLEPVDVGAAINSDGKDLAPFVARDESYLIFTRVGTETRKADLYISFKDSLGHWTEARSMGDDINSEANDVCGSVSPDGKYLFFISQKNGLMNRIYWVDASIIDSIRQRFH